MSRQDHEKNRAAWNEIVDVHFFHPSYRVAEFLAGWNSLKPIELDELGDVRGKSLLHLQCQFGMDTLSWARKGAIVTGVDIADQSIARAEELRERSGLPARFIRSDVLDLGSQLHDQFDIVFQSYGAYFWLEDLAAWGSVVATFLKPGGCFYIVDQHPIWSVFTFPDERRSYFDCGPIRLQNEPDYADSRYIRKSEAVEWQHTLADVVCALTAAGLRIEFLHEFDCSYYPPAADWKQVGAYWYPPDGPPAYPALFSLKARKEPAVHAR